MDLDTNLVKQFVESTNDSNTVTTRKYFYGTFKLTSTSAYVQLDGSDAMTPVSLGSEAKNNDRVVVTIENHKASILSNLTTPASGYSASDLYNEVTDPATGDLTVTGTLKAAKEYVDSLVAENILVENITATTGYISTLTTDNVTAESLTATDAYIKNLLGDNVTAESLTATDAYIKALKTDTIVAGEITANAVTAEELKAMKITVDQLDVTSLDATYAQIDWANITEANVTNLLVKGSFLANDVMSATGIFTKYLTGVNIVGDNITAGTIVTDRLVLKDETPDYYCSSPSDSNYFYSVIYDAETKTYVKQTSIYSFINPHGDSVMDKNGNQATTTTGNLVFNIYKSILYKLNNNILDQTELSYDELKRLTLNGQVITAESITATQIAAEAITASKIKVDTISSISSNLGSIKGGSIDINNNFMVDSEGNLIANSGKFGGDLNGELINIGGTVNAHVEVTNTAVVFKDGINTIGYLAEDKLKITNIEVSGNIYVGKKYSIKEDLNGNFIIGRR